MYYTNTILNDIQINLDINLFILINNIWLYENINIINDKLIKRIDN